MTSWLYLGINHSTNGPRKILIKMFSIVTPDSYSAKLRATNMVKFALFSTADPSPCSAPTQCWVKVMIFLFYTPWRPCHHELGTCCIFLDAQPSPAPIFATARYVISAYFLPHSARTTARRDKFIWLQIATSHRRTRAAKSII